MIAKLWGRVDSIFDGCLILNVGGVGYKIRTTEINLGKFSVGDEAEVFVHTYVREDQISLYGFFSQDELAMFELLISVSGIGPKAALGILTIASVDAIKTAIVRQDYSILTKVSGVGKKTAERVILELSGKIAKLPGKESSDVTSDGEVLEALMAMGYNVSEARSALAMLPKNIVDVSERIKMALKMMKK